MRNQLRILFIAYRDSANPYAVGGDYYIWELAKGLSKLGNDVSLLCSRFQGSEAREFKEGVEVIRLTGSLALPFRIFRHYEKVAKNKFDIIVEEAIGGQRFPFFCTTYVRQPLIAVWYQRHSKVFQGQYPRPLAILMILLEFFMGALYKNRTIIALSKTARVQLLPLGLNPEKVHVVYAGVDKQFDNVELHPNRQHEIVCLGKMRRYKRIDHAILALERLVSRVEKPCQLIIAGKVSEIDGGYIDQLRRLAQEKGIANQVRFGINVSEKEKLELLRKAKVLVQPSPVEGFSIVVAEANRCGTPVVVSDGVPSDVVVNGFNGYVYPFGNIDAFASKMARLISDPVEWKRLSLNAYEWSKQFTWKDSAASLEKILKHNINSEKDVQNNKLGCS